MYYIKFFYWYFLYIKFKIKSWIEIKYIVIIEKFSFKIFGFYLFKFIVFLLVFLIVKEDVSFKFIRVFKYLYLVDCFFFIKVKEIRINFVLK